MPLHRCRPDSPPPPVHDDLGVTADGGPIEAPPVLAKGLSLPPRPRRHPELPETMFTGAGSCCPIMGRQDPGLSPYWPYTSSPQDFAPAKGSTFAGGAVTFLAPNQERAGVHPPWNEGCSWLLLPGSPHMAPGSRSRP